MSYLPEDIPTPDEDIGVHGGEAHCSGCNKQEQILYHSWSPEEGDIWKCKDCLNNKKNREASQPMQAD